MSESERRFWSPEYEWRYRPAELPGEALSPLVQYALTIVNHDVNPSITQQTFNWGSTGTESGHTLGTDNADFAHVSTGADLDRFLRFKVLQTVSTANANLNHVYKLQVNINGGGYADIPLTAGTNKVFLRDDTNITQDGDTTNRLSGGSGGFITNNNHVCDTQDEGGLFSWTNGATAQMETLHSLRFQDAQCAGGDTFDFRLVHGAGSWQAEGTALDAYNVADATLTWAVPPNLTQSDFRIRSPGGIQDASGVDPETDTGWLAAENTSVTADVYDQEFRIRFAVGNASGAGNITDIFQLRYSLNSGAYAVVPNASTPWANSVDQNEVACVPSNATNYPDTSLATSRLSGTGTYSAANSQAVETNATSSVTIAAGNYIEIEYCILVRKLSNDGSLEDGDTIDFRVYLDDGTPLDTYTNTPRVTLDSTRGWIGGSRCETPVNDVVWCGDHGLFALMEYSDFTTGTFQNEIAILRSTDNGVTWAVQDEAGRPGTGVKDLEACDMVWDGGRWLHICWMANTAAKHTRFDLSDMTWDGTIKDLETGAAPTEGQSVAVSYRPHDDTVICYWVQDNAGDDEIYFLKGASAGAATISWDGTATLLDGTASEVFCAPVAVCDSRGVTHVVYLAIPNSGRTTSNGDLVYKSIAKDNTLTSDGARVSLLTAETISGLGVNDRMPHGPLRLYIDAGVERIGIVFKEETSNLLYFTQTAVSSISWSTEQQVSDSAGIHDSGGGSHQVQADMVFDPRADVHHAFWSRTSDGALMHDDRVSGSWGTDVNELTPSVGGEFRWVRMLYWEDRATNTRYLGGLLNVEVNGGATGGAFFWSAGSQGTAIDNAAVTTATNGTVYVTDDEPWMYKGTGDASFSYVDGMTVTPGAGTYLIIAQAEFYVTRGNNDYAILQIGYGATPTYTGANRYWRTNVGLNHQFLSIATIAHATVSVGETIRMYASGTNGVGTHFTLGKRSLILIPLSTSQIWTRGALDEVTTSTTDFSAALPNVTMTQGSTTAVDTSTTLPAGDFLGLFSGYAYKNNTTSGVISEYRPYVNNAEISANLRTRIDFGSQELSNPGNTRIPFILPFKVTVGTSESVEIRWATTGAASTIAMRSRVLYLVPASALDVLMVSGVTTDSEATADTYKAVDDLTHTAPGADDWVGFWKTQLTSEDTTVPGQILTFGLGENGTVRATTEVRQSYPDSMGTSGDQLTASGAGRVTLSTGNADLRWKADNTTSRSAFERVLVLVRKAVSSDRQARVSAYELEVPNAPRRVRVSAYELELPNAPRRARVSAYELEVPTAPRRARVSAYELEVPTAPRRARVSAYELEMPNAPRRARISAYELELPDAPRRVRVSAFELETPTAPRRARISAYEFEVIDPNKARISAFELEVPNAPRRARVSAYELEVPSAPRRVRVSAFELEVPNANRAARVSAYELEVPLAPRRARVSAFEQEVPDAPRRVRVSAYELEVPNAPRRVRVSAYELEVPNTNKARLSAFELEVPNAPRRARVSAYELEVPLAPRRARISAYELEVPSLANRAARVSAYELEMGDAPRRARVSAFELEVPTAPRRVRVSAFELEVPTAPRTGRVSAFELEMGSAPRAARVSAFELQLPDVGAPPVEGSRRHDTLIGYGFGF